MLRRSLVAVLGWTAALPLRAEEPLRLAQGGWQGSRPVAPNTRPDGSDDPEGRQRNRRVQVFIRQG